MTAKTISWTADKLAVLKKAVSDHKGSKDDVIEITLQPEGKLEFIVGYALHLIEYLDEQFRRPAKAGRVNNEGEESYTTGSGSWEDSCRWA